MEKHFVYADNAATTPISSGVLNAMLPFLGECYGNPSSIYEKGRQAKTAMEKARGKVAKVIGAEPNEVFFTSSATESDNWAIKGAAELAAATGRRHLITTNVEHHAVLNSFASLEKQGFETTYLKADRYGSVGADQLKSALRPDTALVSVMYANNEIGTLMPIDELASICKNAGVLFHTDAVQAIGNVAIDVHRQNIDMLSLTGHKIRAPKGVGALYIREGVSIGNFMDGGAQEMGLRAGTENVASIVALGQAAQYAYENLAKASAHKKKLRQALIGMISASIPRFRINGSLENTLPGILNISFEGIEGEALLLMLDMHGICASSGSACTAGSPEPSHVLTAIGLPPETAHGSVRLSFGEQNTIEDIEHIARVLPVVVGKLREMSPLWDKI